MKLNDPLLLRELCFIDGGWMPADAGDTLDVHNPATGEKLGQIPKMGVAETRRAIAAAARAMPAWAARTGKDRSLVLRRWFDLMLVHLDDLALLMTAEQGKPLAESKG
jgi:succinate-semialdehyde dehydrogenase/glutarate-semialdehyde dehydrogenase